MKITLKIVENGKWIGLMVAEEVGERPNGGGDECLCADAFKFKSNQIDLLTVPVSLFYSRQGYTRKML